MINFFFFLQTTGPYGSKCRNVAKIRLREFRKSFSFPREIGSPGRRIDRGDCGFRGTGGGLNPHLCARDSSWNMDLESPSKKLYERSRPPAASLSAIITDDGVPRYLSTYYPKSCRGKKSFPGAGGFTEINALASACSARPRPSRERFYVLALISARHQQ